MKPLRFIYPAILLFGYFLGSCNLLEVDTPVRGIDEPVTIGEIQLAVVNASIQRSYSVHYLMKYPAEGQIFLGITASIQGFSNPRAAVDWASGNLKLASDRAEAKLAYATWIITGNDIQYKSGEDFDYLYRFIYLVPENSDFAEYRWELPGGVQVPLDKILDDQTPNSIADSLAGKSTASAASSEDSIENIELFASIGGGSGNISSAYHTTVGGGNLNTATVAYGTIGGGRENSAKNLYTTVGGGYGNMAAGRDATISGGSRNTASNTHATIGGGMRNSASASDSTIAGGSYNLSSQPYASVGGGTQNEASGSGSVVSGGAGNAASNNQATVAGGLGNLASGIYATVGGGQGNTASGAYSAVVGGQGNQAGGDYSLSLGHLSVNEPGHPGVFLFADSSAFEFQSRSANEFAARATGGVRFVTAVDQVGREVSGVSLPPGSGSWSSLSDRD